MHRVSFSHVSSVWETGSAQNLSEVALACGSLPSPIQNPNRVAACGGESPQKAAGGAKVAGGGRRLIHGRAGGKVRRLTCCLTNIRYKHTIGNRTFVPWHPNSHSPSCGWPLSRLRSARMGGPIIYPCTLSCHNSLWAQNRLFWCAHNVVCYRLLRTRFGGGKLVRDSDACNVIMLVTRFSLEQMCQ